MQKRIFAEKDLCIQDARVETLLHQIRAIYFILSIIMKTPLSSHDCHLIVHADCIFDTVAQHVGGQSFERRVIVGCSCRLQVARILSLMCTM